MELVPKLKISVGRGSAEKIRGEGGAGGARGDKKMKAGLGFTHWRFLNSENLRLTDSKFATLSAFYDARSLAGTQWDKKICNKKQLGFVYIAKDILRVKLHNN